MGYENHRVTTVTKYSIPDETSKGVRRRRVEELVHQPNEQATRGEVCIILVRVAYEKLWSEVEIHPIMIRPRATSTRRRPGSGNTPGYVAFSVPEWLSSAV